jgi:hypothetical protein
MLLLISTHRNNHKKEEEQEKKEQSIIADITQMDLFICFMYMRDSCTDAGNEKEMETEY